MVPCAPRHEKLRPFNGIDAGSVRGQNTLIRAEQPLMKLADVSAMSMTGKHQVNSDVGVFPDTLRVMG